MSCKHINTKHRVEALLEGGRYWDGTKWRCPWCEDWDGAVEEADKLYEAVRKVACEADAAEVARRLTI